MWRNINSGYHGNRMSNRAVEAYDMGEKPLSKWTKEDILREIKKTGGLSKNKYAEVCKWTKQELISAFLKKSSWHHTSAAFNTTDFYSIDEESVNNNVSRPKVIKLDKPKEVPGYVHGEYKDVEYHPYSKYHKYTEQWISFENGVIKGDWLILENGKKKKLSNVKITARTKTKRRRKKRCF